MLAGGMPNDAVSSLMVPYGYQVVLYKDGGFSGATKTVTGPMFGDADEDLACINIYSDFNDRVSSFKIYRTQNIGLAQGLSLIHI